jgi:DNA-binding transcriptional regulator YdaS (Cro superfamily)
MVETLTPYEALLLCQRKAGGTQEKLADGLGCSQTAVWKMLQSARRMSLPYVLQAERLYGIPCYILRPDIYPRQTMTDQGSADRFYGVDQLARRVA